MDKLSNLFAGRAMGLPSQDELIEKQEKEKLLREQEEYLNKQKDITGTKNTHTNNINFQDKIMGGKNFNFLEGKMPNIIGETAYAQKVDNMLGFKKDKYNKNDKNYISNKFDMLTSKFDFNKTFNTKKFFDYGEDSKNKKIKDLISGVTENTQDNFEDFNQKVKKSLNFGLMNAHNNNKQKNDLFKSPKMPNLANKFFGINISGSNLFNTKKANLNEFNNKSIDIKKIISGNTSNKGNYKIQQNAVNKINNAFGLKVFNPEKLSKKRMKQQNGLSLFNDFDGDKVANIFDCDPLDPNKQDEGKNNLLYYTQGANAQGVNTQSDNNKKQQNTPDNFYNTESDIDYGDLNNNNIDYNNVDYNNNLGLNYGENNNNNNNVQGNTVSGSNIQNLQLNSRMKKMIEQAEESISSADTEKEKTKALNAYNQLLKLYQKQSEKYGDRNAISDILKYNNLSYVEDKRDERDARADKRLREQMKQNLTLNAQKLNLQEKQMEGDTDLKQKRLYGDILKQNRDFALQKQKLKLEQQQKGLETWDKKIEAGTNLLGNLINTGGTMNNAKDVIGGLGNSLNLTSQNITGMQSNKSALDPAMLQGSKRINPAMLNNSGSGIQGIATMSGAMSQSPSFSQKVMDSVGNKNMMQNSNYDYLNQSNVQQPVAQQSFPQQHVAQQSFPQQPVAQPSEKIIQNNYMRQQSTMRQQSPIRQPNINFQNVDWEKINPEQVEQVDPEYAEYLKETKGKRTYRRGPYKKD